LFNSATQNGLQTKFSAISALKFCGDFILGFRQSNVTLTFYEAQRELYSFRKNACATKHVGKVKRRYNYRVKVLFTTLFGVVNI
jgi:hypothetical protein